MAPFFIMGDYCVCASCANYNLLGQRAEPWTLVSAVSIITHVRCIQLLLYLVPSDKWWQTLQHCSEITQGEVSLLPNHTLPYEMSCPRCLFWGGHGHCFTKTSLDVSVQYIIYKIQFSHYFSRSQLLGCQHLPVYKRVVTLQNKPPSIKVISVNPKNTN